LPVKSRQPLTARPAQPTFPSSRYTLLRSSAVDLCRFFSPLPLRTQAPFAVRYQATVFRAGNCTHTPVNHTGLQGLTLCLGFFRSVYDSALPRLLPPLSYRLRQPLDLLLIPEFFIEFQAQCHCVWPCLFRFGLPPANPTRMAIDSRFRGPISELASAIRHYFKSIPWTECWF
jgi:hypothetical protein